MLDDTTYFNGMVIYLVAGGMAALYLTWWLSRSLSTALSIALGLCAAALLLTPAYQGESADTMAPALIVAAFEWLTHGPDAAARAIRPLGATLAAAGALGIVVLALGWLLGRRKPRDANGENAGNEVAS